MFDGFDVELTARWRGITTCTEGVYCEIEHIESNKNMLTIFNLYKQVKGVFVHFRLRDSRVVFFQLGIHIVEIPLHLFIIELLDDTLRVHLNTVMLCTRLEDVLKAIGKLEIIHAV